MANNQSENQSKAGLWALLVALVAAGGTIGVALINRQPQPKPLESQSQPQAPQTGGGGTEGKQDDPMPFTVTVRQAGQAVGDISGANIQLVMDDGTAYDGSSDDHGLYTFNLKPAELTGMLSVYKDGYLGLQDIGVNMRTGSRYAFVSLPTAAASVPSAPTHTAISAPLSETANTGTPNTVSHPLPARSLMILEGRTKWISAPMKPIPANKLTVNPLSQRFHLPPSPSN